MPKFVKKPQTQEMIADSIWANEQEDRIAISIDSLYDYTKALDPNKFTLLYDGSISIGNTVTLNEPCNNFNFIGFGIEGSANIVVAALTSFSGVLRATMSAPTNNGGVLTTCQFTYDMNDKTKITFNDITTFQLPAMTFSKTQKINRIFGFR